MKIWVSRLDNATPDVADLSVKQGYMDLTEFLDILEKSGFHRGGKQSDLPKPLELAEPDSSLDFPKTPQEINSLLSCLDIAHLERAADQWLASGCVTNEQYQLLTMRLGQLVERCGMLRQAIRQVQYDKLRPKAGVKA